MLVNVPCLDALLERHVDALGADFEAYRNHTYRVVNFHSLLVSGEAFELDKVVIAAAYHDIGIWTAGTFDYLPPSLLLATAYLVEIDRAAWSEEIAAMIRNHHKLTQCRGLPPSVELFRRADWVDVSMGWIRFGLSRHAVAQVMAYFPDAGFHRLLLKLFLLRLMRHPLNPLPMFRW